MAVDETELSFIRCPNCRSLVPAVAARCRMCGFILKENRETVQSDDRPSRVRQRTISATHEDIQEIKQQIDAEIQRAAQAEQKKSSQQQESLEEKISAPLSPPPERVPYHSIDTEDDFPVEAEEYFDEEEAAEPANFENVAPEGPRRRKRRRKKKRVAGAEISSVSSPQAQISTASATGVKDLPPPLRVEAPVRHEVPQMDEVQIKEAAINKANADEDENVPQIPRWGNSESTRTGFQLKSVETHSPKLEPEPTREPEPIEKEKEEVQRVHQVKPQKLEVQENIVPIDGSLIGWLVSFNEDPRGNSREIRDGRFFVGAERLRPSDFVIEHESVSTPQCLVVCEAERGVTIQDLMSERGTFIKRAGSRDYERHSDQVELRNGDWVRFGNFEMLFVAVPR